MKNSTSYGRSNGNGGSKKKGNDQGEVTSGLGSKGTSVCPGGTVGLNGKLKAEHLQSDREAFLNAFEKPTQIYRYIRSRTIHSPIFLHRNLTYMKERMSRNHRNRPTFHVDNMLAVAEAKIDAEKKNSGKDTAKNFYNIVLLGLMDPDNTWVPETKAKVEIQIARICVKKRKDVRVPINKAFEGVCEVKVQSVTNCTNSSSPPPPLSSTNNYNNNIIPPHYSNHHLPLKLCPVISVPSECFNLVNGHVVRSYVLMVKVSIPKSALVKGGLKTENGATPFVQQSTSTKTASPVPQVSKKTASVTVRTSPPSLGNANCNHNNNSVTFTVNPSSWTASGLGNLKPEDFNPKVIIKQEDQAQVHVMTSAMVGSSASGGDEEPKPKRRRSAPRDREQFIYTAIGGSGGGHRGGDNFDDMVFMGQITIYDKQLSITLGAADYELILRQCQKRRASFSLNRSRLVNQEASWEILESTHPKIQIFPNTGTGRAKLNVAIRTSALKVGPFMDRPLSVLSSSTVNGCITHSEDKKSEDGSKGSPTSSTNHTKVIYQFLYNNNSRQQTEAREDLRCPWCSLNCLALYSLLKHLKLCHPRFHFAYVPVPSGARIDVSINDSFDGSYSGSAYDLVAQPPGEAFARNGPTKRTNIFSILVCRPQKVIPSLLEFLENEEKDVDHRKTFITGHNRLYHHTTTCLPIQPKEIDVDSEGEPDPEWLQIKTSMMIDEFTDVNEGEKELMKMWNLHVLKHNYVGDCLIPLACEKFVEYKGKDIIKKNLYRNFILHLTNLFDFGLLSPQSMYQTVQALHGQMKETNTASSLRDSWRAQLPPPVPGSTFTSKFMKTQTLSLELSNLHLVTASCSRTNTSSPITKPIETFDNLPSI